MSHKKMLQIVTRGAKKLKYSRKIYCFLAALTLLNACATDKEPVNKTTPETSHAIQIEPQKGRMNIETSVARAAKYNINTVKTQIQSKIIGDEALNNAFLNLKKIRENQTQTLSTSLKELDFAILYASANMQTHPDRIDSYLNQTTAQNITLATIKAHKSAMFANKKIFELHRKIRQYQKQIEALLKKPSATGTSYQKELENSIDTLSALTKQLELDVSNFKQLVKIEPSTKLELESKGFYDRTILPPQSNAETYQKEAFIQRQELIDFSGESFDAIHQTYSQEQPLLSPGVKGFYISDSSQQQYLITKADSIASALLQSTLDYQKASSKKQQKLLPGLKNSLRQAIYLQVALAHELAKKTAADYEAQKAQNKELSQNIRKLEKTSHPTERQKTDLLQAKTDLIKSEIIEDQILAERAMTVTALKFYDGQIYLTPESLNKNISELSLQFKQAFEKKLPPATNKEKNSSQTLQETDFIEENPNSWAHKENWLEALMAETKNKSPKKVSSPAVSGRMDFNSKTILQLGAFLDKESAINEWNKLSAKFSELQKYQPVYEQTSAAGIAIFRLTIKSPNGGFKNLCIRLRHEGHECILRD